MTAAATDRAVPSYWPAKWRELPGLSTDSVLVELGWYQDASPSTPGAVALRVGREAAYYVLRFSTLLCDEPERGSRCSWRLIDGEMPDADTLAEIGIDVRRHVDNRRTDRPHHLMSYEQIGSRIEAATVELARTSYSVPLSAADVMHGRKAGGS